QVRMEGTVARLPAEESDAYFATRPRERRLGAWASRQGSVLPSRAALEDRVRELSEQFGEAIPRPEWWGGYLLRPDVVELWERRPERLHERTHFGLRPDGTWDAARLAP
ncbi:MAG: pyridoxamine 5'-phosphate oxidase, partial [Actinomycetota bacterium]|nr:pyridoxamine 5'-phosphate oxidase [Actinomycetota bacterium]